MRRTVVSFIIYMTVALGLAFGAGVALGYLIGPPYSAGVSTLVGVAIGTALINVWAMRHLYRRRS